MNLRKYTLTDLIVAVKSSISIRECLNKLNVSSYGGNYETFKKAITYYNIDTSHFLGKRAGHIKNVGNTNTKTPLDIILTSNYSYESNKLRKRLISENIFTEICSRCNNTTWQSEPIPLELDHIDGNTKNNLISNLRLLCPNCHALTPTYRGKNIK